MALSGSHLIHAFASGTRGDVPGGFEERPPQRFPKEVTPLHLGSPLPPPPWGREGSSLRVKLTGWGWQRDRRTESPLTTRSHTPPRPSGEAS